MPDDEPAADVLVCGGGTAAMTDLVRLAEALRGAGWRIELDVRGRSIAANLRHADRTRIPHVAILGEEERAAGVVTWRAMATRTEERLPLRELVERGPAKGTRTSRQDAKRAKGTPRN